MKNSHSGREGGFGVCADTRTLTLYTAGTVVVEEKLVFYKLESNCKMNDRMIEAI